MSQVNVYEVFVVIFAFGTFLVTLLTLVVRIMNKK
ncbi:MULTISPECIES: putative holin-like toxin [Virgibacillus]|nr:putative holin-like toxin [Virgibacillus dokdonensis]